MIQELRRWRNSDAVGVTIEVRGDDGEVIAVVGDPPPPGATFLTDEEYISTILAQFINQKKAYLKAEEAVLANSLTLEEERNTARQELLSSGISLTTVDLMLPVRRPSEPRGFEVPSGTLDHLIKAHMLSTEQAETLIEQVISA